MELYWNKYNKTLDITIWKEYYITIRNKKTNTTDKENKTMNTMANDDKKVVMFLVNT